MKPNQDPDLHLSQKPDTDPHESESRELQRLTVEPWRLTLRPRRLTMKLWWLTMDLDPYQVKSQIRIRIKVKIRFATVVEKHRIGFPERNLREKNNSLLVYAATVHFFLADGDLQQRE